MMNVKQKQTCSGAVVVSIVVTTERSTKSKTAVERKTEATPREARTITSQTSFPLALLTMLRWCQPCSEVLAQNWRKAYEGPPPPPPPPPLIMPPSRELRSHSGSMLAPNYFVLLVTHGLHGGLVGSFVRHSFFSCSVLSAEVRTR